ncbi:MAG: HEAT repeat domain-containing protein [Planctomycetota bacterium]|nr:MAG: HEAT repeat domain-containing protein [Planctomycetota bacterium]
MTHRTPARGLLLAVLLLLVPAALPAQSGDAETLFLEGKHAFRQGDMDTALAKFREVVRLDPSHAEAYRLLASSQDFLAALMAEGGEFETFALDVLRAAQTARAEKRRDAAAAAALADRALHGSYAERSRAIFEGTQVHGAFFAPPLVAALASDDEDVRLNAYYALSRMGAEAFLPVAAAAWSSDSRIRLGCVQVLLASGDPRGDAILADLAANDADGAVRALAAEGAEGDAAELHARQGWAFYHRDPRLGLTEVENEGVYWTIDGDELIANEIEPARLPLFLARAHFQRALELGRDTRAELALVHAAEAALLGEDGEEQVVAALGLGPAALDGALGLALENDDVAAAAVLAELLTGPAAGRSAYLRAALVADAPTVRYAAAAALADSGLATPEVVGQLAAAVQLEAVRVVHLIDADQERAEALRAALDARGVVALVAADGAGGLVNASRGLPADAIVIGDPLPDFYARRLVKHLRRKSDLAETPIFVLDSGETGDIDGAEVVEAVGAEEVIAAFPELDAERQSYRAAAAKAAGSLAALAARDAAAVAPATPALAAVVGRDDEVSLPAMRALALAGGPEAIPALAEVVADGGRSSAARAGAADALAGILDRNPGAGSGLAETLKAAMGEGDAALARACARALGFLGGGVG